MTDKGLSDGAATVARAIRLARRSSGLSQEQLAEAIGVHRPSVSNWERGQHEPTARNLEDVARALGLSVTALLEFGATEGATVGQVRETSRGYEARIAPRIPPRAYQLVFDHCTTLERAGVPEDVVEEARRLMSGTTFNTLNKHMSDARTEEGWVKDVQAAWAFIRDTLKAQGFAI